MALAVTAALLWHSATPAQACSCVTRTTEESVAGADTIVVGTVGDYRNLGEEHLEDDPRLVVSRIGVTVGVQTYLKGSGPERIVVEELHDCDGFLDPSSVGGEYVLVLQGERSPFTSTGMCSGSFAIHNQYQPLPDDIPFLTGFVAEQYAALGGIVAFTGPGIAPTTNKAPTIPLTIAAIAIPLAFFLAASFVFPAKGSRP